MKIIAKFKCLSVTRHEGDSETVRMQAAYGPGNEQWSKFTPSGSLEVCITNPACAGAFEPGKHYHLTFEPTEEG